MIHLGTQLIVASDQGGISSLGINLKSFLFQLATFVIVLLILRRWVFPKLVHTLEARRKTLEESLVQAKQTQEALERAEEKSSEILHKARQQADATLADADERVKALIAKAEAAAQDQAQRVLVEGKAQLDQEKTKLREELKSELANLVVMTTEKVLGSKLNKSEDSRLVASAIKEIK